MLDLYNIEIKIAQMMSNNNFLHLKTVYQLSIIW